MDVVGSSHGLVATTTTLASGYTLPSMRTSFISRSSSLCAVATSPLESVDVGVSVHPVSITSLPAVSLATTALPPVVLDDTSVALSATVISVVLVGGVQLVTVLVTLADNLLVMTTLQSVVLVCDLANASGATFVQVIRVGNVTLKAVIVTTFVGLGFGAAAFLGVGPAGVSTSAV